MCGFRSLLKVVQKTAKDLALLPINELYQRDLYTMTTEPTITFETSTYYSETLTNKDYLTEEEALRDDPLTDIMMAVSIEKSDVKLAGTTLFSLSFSLTHRNNHAFYMG